ncbi:MAG: hypothetical protein U5M50_11035 [Sphingobium sp.]|nr:hypothetical protein [Sphingobium sp.]
MFDAAGIVPPADTPRQVWDERPVMQSHSSLDTLQRKRPGMFGNIPKLGASSAVPSSVLSAPLDISSIDGGGIPMQPVAKVRKPGFLSGVGDFLGSDGFRDLLGNLGDAFSGNAGQPGSYAAFKAGQRQRQQALDDRNALWARLDAQRAEDRQWRVEDRDAQLNAPQYFMSGRDRIRLDPETGQSAVVYDGPTDFQEYADLMGLEPGTEDYRNAMQDFVLRSNGPTAQAGRVDLEGVRQGNRVALRSLPTYAQTHPRPSSSRQGSSGSGGRSPTYAGVFAPIYGKIASGVPLTSGEQAALDRYRGGRGHGVSGGGQSGIVSARTPEEARRLPKGTVYRTAQGKVMVR